MKYEEKMLKNNKFKTLALVTALLGVSGAAFGNSPIKGQNETVDDVLSVNLEHQREIDKIRRATSLAAAEAVLAKTKLESITINKEIKQAEKPEVEEPAFDQLLQPGYPGFPPGHPGAAMGFPGAASGLPDYMSGMNPHGPSQDEPAEPEETVEEKPEELPVFTTLDYTFVIRVHAFGESNSAQLLIDGSTYNVNEKDNVLGIKIVKIEDDAVTLTFENETKRLPVVNKARALSETQRLDDLKKPKEPVFSGPRFVPARIN